MSRLSVHPPSVPRRGCRARLALGLGLAVAAWGQAAVASAAVEQAPTATPLQGGKVFFSSRQPLFGAPGHALHPRLGLSLRAHAGALLPHGEFSRNARAAVAYGGALAGEWSLHPQHGLRLGAHYTRAQFTAKASDLYGPVTANLLALHADYLWGQAWWRPYIGGGIGIDPWRGLIEQPVSGRAHPGQGDSIMYTAAMGLDLDLVAHLALTPELSWTYVGGNFKAALWGAGLALRARI